VSDTPDQLAGHGLPQGMLGTRAQWVLPIGTAQAAPIRRVARALILLLLAITVYWCLALLADARAGQGEWTTALWVGAASLAWLGCVIWPLWRGLSRQGVVTLAWGGLPSSRAESPWHHSGESATLPGWSIREWPAPMSAVSVNVVFDLGAWMLVKVVSKNRAVAAPSIMWSWLKTRAWFNTGTGHHLRALLFNPGANEVGCQAATDADVTVVVASCGGTQRQWSNLFSSFKTTGAETGQGAIRREAGAQKKIIKAGDDFAATVILDESDGGPPRTGAVVALAHSARSHP
jgi:hypothetical protein